MSEQKAKTYICNCLDSYTIENCGQCLHRAQRLLILTGCEADPGNLCFFPDYPLKVFVVHTACSQWDTNGLKSG